MKMVPIADGEHMRGAHRKREKRMAPASLNKAEGECVDVI